MKTKPTQDFPDTTPKPSHGAGETALVLAVLAVLAAATVWGIPLAILLGLAAIAYGVLGLRERGQRAPVLIGLGLGAATAAVGCGVLVWFLDGLPHPYGPLPGELVSQGSVYKAPLGPGKTARYRDGVKVTVSEARRVPHLTGDLWLKEGDLTYEFAVTYANDRDKPLPLAGNGIKDEKKIMPGSVMPEGPLAPEWDLHHPWFPKELAPHQNVTVKMHANVPPGSTALDFTCSPTDDRDDAHWLLPLV